MLATAIFFKKTLRPENMLSFEKRGRKVICEFKSRSSH